MNNLGRIFSTESPVYQWLTKYCTVMLCGLAWFFLLVPIVTAGASCTAMSRMMFNIREDKPAGLKLFFKTFAAEFKKSTIIWLIDMVCIAVLFVLLSFAGTSNMIVLTLMFVPVMLWIFTFLYVFPLTAFFDNTVKGTIKNGFLMSIKFFKQTIPALALSMIPFFGYLILGDYYFLYSVPIWVFVILPFIEYWKSYFFLKVFYNFLPEERQIAFKKTKPDSEETGDDENQ